MIASDIALDVVRDVGAFAALEKDWSALLECAERSSIFMTWEWQLLWWKQYGGSQPLHLLTVRRAGELVGVLPLYVQTRRALRLVPVRLLRNVGTGADTAPDDLDPLIHRDHAEAVAQALVDALFVRPPDCDVVRVADFDPSSTFARAIGGASDRIGCRTVHGVSAQISYLPLEGGWDNFLAAVSSERRANIRRFRRKFESLSGARFLVWTDAERLDEAIDRLRDLHHMRWSGRGEHAFSSGDYISFHRQVMHACTRRGWLRLYALEVDNEIIAMYYCYSFGGRTFYFQGGFDPGFSKWGPGAVLMGYAIEHAASEGRIAFDMLRGEYEYKRQWAKEIRTTVVVDRFHATFPSLALRLQLNLRPTVGRTLRAVARFYKHPAVVEAKQ